MKLTIATLLFTYLFSHQGGTDKPFYKITLHNTHIIAVTCPGNGGDPTERVTNIQGTLIIDCGTETDTQ